MISHVHVHEHLLLMPAGASSCMFTSSSVHDAIFVSLHDVGACMTRCNHRLSLIQPASGYLQQEYHSEMSLHQQHWRQHQPYVMFVCFCHCWEPPAMQGLADSNSSSIIGHGLSFLGRAGVVYLWPGRSLHQHRHSLLILPVALHLAHQVGPSPACPIACA